VVAPLEELISLEDAAELCGRAQVTLRQAVTRGRLYAVKVGKTWITTPDAVAEYIATSRERTRPRRGRR
jgi:predicted transcriptional regulator of viral defense system